MSTNSHFNNEFRTETTALYAVGLTFILLRLGSRTQKLGLRRLSSDDWFMAQNIVWYTLLYVSLDKVIFGGGSNFMTDKETAELTPETRETRIAGSKWVMVSEESVVLTIWSCKACMLFIYRRLTQGLKQLKIVNAVTIYVSLGFIGTQIALFTNCRPFSGYWSVPASSYQCWSYYNYAIVEGCFNVSADLVLLVVGMPLLFKVRIPLQQKMILLAIFGMGMFVIAAAVLCKVYSLYPPLLSYTYTKWYFREASVSVYVTNIPVIYSLVREVFPALARWGYNTNKGSTGRSNGIGRNRTSTKDIGMKPFDRLGSTTDDMDDSLNTQSQEHIIQYKAPGPLTIQKDVTFSVQKDCFDDEDHEIGRMPHHDPAHHHSSAYASAR
ncbi:MAG: hypothetical protein LQ343_000792 [Gyalolechia ehrenbergii]|nr:MAG: hypothetical protein LQ343_000792 [Gyalolechia ehrenbergii]